MAPQFDEAAFALKPGDHTGIVESSHGFHIIKRLK
jgi:parvulin-like peptidyl-prolyl isomerase